MGSAVFLAVKQPQRRFMRCYTIRVITAEKADEIAQPAAPQSLFGKRKYVPISHFRNCNLQFLELFRVAPAKAPSDEGTVSKAD